MINQNARAATEKFCYSLGSRQSMAAAARGELIGLFSNNQFKLTGLSKFLIRPLIFRFNRI